jgi:lysophospholipase L1-like esterase
VFGQTTDDGASATADAAFAKLDALIDSIKAANASTKVGLMVPTPPAGQDGFGVNYANGQTAWRDRRNILIWGRQLIAKYSGQEASRVYVVPSNLAFDTANNYPRTGAAPVNARNSSITVQRQSNGVHPDTSGYQQIGDAVWSFLKYYA